MTLENLKVESASVRVSNANEADREYNISANICTRNSEIVGIDGGIVNKVDGFNVANFYSNMEYENSLSITYMNDIHDDVDVQCIINQLINEFINIASNKALAEAAE